MPAIIPLNKAAGDRTACAELAHRDQLPFLLVVSGHERYLREVAQAVRDRTRGAHVLEPDGSAQATDLLGAHPELAELIATWFKRRFETPAG